MNQKQIIIILIVVILAVLACLTTYMLVNSYEESFTTIRISNSCTIEVPNENMTIEHANGGISRFSFNPSNLTIMHQNSANNSQIKVMNTNLIKNSQQIENNIYYDNSTGIYSTFIENPSTGDALLITSNDLELLKRVANSVKFSKTINMTINNTDNTTDDSAQNDTTNPIPDNSISQTNNSQSNSNNKPTPSPTSDDSSDSGSKPEEDSKYPSFLNLPDLLEVGDSQT